MRFGYRDALTYGYSNTRVKAMKAKLLDRQAKQTLINSKDFSTMLSILFQSDYKPEIMDFGGVNMKSMLIDFALSKNFARRINKIYDIAPRKKNWIIRSMIGRWDIYNAKLALEAIDRRMSYEAIAEYVIDSGPFNAQFIKEMMKEARIDEAFGRFMLKGGGYYGNMLKAARSAYMKNKDVLEAIAEIDKRYYENLGNAANAIEGESRNTASLIRMDIDMKNVLTMIRGKRHTLKFADISNYIISNGSVAKSEVDRLYSGSSSVEDMLFNVKTFDLSEALKRYKAAEGGNRGLFVFETTMRNEIFNKATRLLSLSVLSFDVLTAYIYLKEIELFNLRALIKGRIYGLEKDEIERLMVWRAN